MPSMPTHQEPSDHLFVSGRAIATPRHRRAKWLSRAVSMLPRLATTRPSSVPRDRRDTPSCEAGSAPRPPLCTIAIATSNAPTVSTPPQFPPLMSAAAELPGSDHDLPAQASAATGRGLHSRHRSRRLNPKSSRCSIATKSRRSSSMLVAARQQATAPRPPQQPRRAAPASGGRSPAFVPPVALLPAIISWPLRGQC